MKKILKWLGIVLLSPIIIFLLLSVLLYLHPVQNWAAQKVCDYASENTDCDVSVGRVRLRFPLDLTIEDFKLKERSTEKADPLELQCEKFDVDIQLLPLFRKQVEIDNLRFHKAKLNSNGLIAEARVKGDIDELKLESHGINLKEELLRLDMAHIKDANLDIALTDSVSTDTTKTENKWKILAEKINIDNTKITLRTPGDTLQVDAELGKLRATGGNIDLGKEEYRLGNVALAESSLSYNNKYEKPVAGFDANHISLDKLELDIDSVSYIGSHLDLSLKKCSFREKSGIQLDNLSGNVRLDSTKVCVPNLSLKTPDSRIDANLDLDLNTFDSKNPGKMNATLDASIGKQDIMRFLGDMPADFRRQWPNHPLTVSGTVAGNMQRVSLSGLNINLPTAIHANATGWIENPTNSNKLKADIKLRGTTGNMNFVTSLLDKDTRKNINIPNNIGIDGRFKANGSRYSANFEAREGGGKLTADVDIETKSMTYHADVKANNFPVNHFVKGVNLSPFTGTVKADGTGTDIMSPKTRLTATVKIDKLTFDGYDLSGMKANATVNNGKAVASIDSRNPLFNGKIDLHALTNSKMMNATIVGDISQLDLYKMRLVDSPINTSGCVHVDISTDLNNYYKLQGYVSDLQVVTSDNKYRSDDFVIDLLTNRDTTHVSLNSSDLKLKVDGKGGYKRLLSQTEKLVDEIKRQYKDRRIDQPALKQRLPDVSLYLDAGNDNFIVEMLNSKGYNYKKVFADIQSSSHTGLNGNVYVDSMCIDSVRIDKVKLNLKTENDVFAYNAQIQNNKDNPQYVFNALIDGTLSETGSDIRARVFDKNDDLGVDLGLAAVMEESGMRIRLSDTQPILGYKQFTANDDNYIYLSDDKRLSARLQLQSADGMGVQLYTDDSNTNALQDLTLSLHHFDLQPITSSLPYLPRMTGILNGDYHIIQTTDELSVSTAMNIDNMTYENCPMGNIGTEFVYMPKENGEHHIDGILMRDDDEVATIKGNYNAKTEMIDADLKLNRIPLELVNGFIPDQIFGLRGFGDGQLTMKGKLSKPDVNGEIYLDESYIFSQPYGVEMRFANDPVRIVGSHLLFENFEMFAYNDESLNISGSFDFSNLDKMYLDVRMRAQNFQLINAKENARSETYGKAFVNFFGMMKGRLDNLQMRGRLDVLGSTDMTYILRDAPLTTDNRLNELVTFVNFSDSTKVQVNRPPINGVSMDLSIGIDENAHIKCDLNADHSNYIDLVGGGDLRMQYNVVDNLRLTGKYTLANGEMKYSLPIIPLKTFTIQDGSYLEFLGDAMNPRLNITATERIKATVGGDGGVSRSVDFNCGVVITKTLKDMGLEFIVDAPEDLAISNELNTMSKEDRGKVAVTMLTTGMYLADGNTSGFTMNGALSSFLQNEINNLTGSALRTLDLSIGVDNATDATGNLHTDYSFKFAKRFWNNRLRISVGGKVSTGPDVAGQNQSFFDNVTFEYRLNENANKYLKLFYDRNSYDWIEGNVGEYGAGFLWRRKLQHFRDIFRFKNDRQRIPFKPVKRDSLGNGRSSDTLNVNNNSRK